MTKLIPPEHGVDETSRLRDFGELKAQDADGLQELLTDRFKKGLHVMILNSILTGRCFNFDHTDFSES